MSDSPASGTSVNSIINLLHAEKFDVLGLMQRRWKYVAGGVALGTVLSIAYYCVASTKYESTAQILIMKKDANLPTRGVENPSENASQVTEDLLATHMQIVQSPQIIRAGLRKGQLEGLKSIQQRLAGDLNEVEYIIDHLKVTRGGTGQARLANVLNLTFRHTSDEDCEKVLGSVVEGYQAFLADKFQDVSKEAVKLIAQAKDELGADLEAAEAAYQKFREQAPLLWNGDVSSNTHRLNFERLQAALSDLQVNYSAARTRLEIVEQRLARGGDKINDLELLALLDDSHTARLGLLVAVKQGAANSEEFQVTVPDRTANSRAEYEGLLALVLKEKTLTADFGADHPLVQDVHSQMGVVKSFINQKERGIQQWSAESNATRCIELDAGLRHAAQKRPGNSHVAANGDDADGP